jgi:hypothetical protein
MGFGPVVVAFPADATPDHLFLEDETGNAGTK